MPLNLELNPSAIIPQAEPGVTKSIYDDVYPQTVKVDDSFNGTLDFEFQSAANQAIDWSQSFFELSIDLHDTSNAVLTAPVINASGYQVAPMLISYNAVAGLFSQFQLSINSVPISTVTNFTQVDTYAKRTSITSEQSRTWGSTNLLERGDLERMWKSGWSNTSGICIDPKYRYGTQVLGNLINTVEWQPSVSLFFNESTTVGQQRYRISLTIDPNYKRNFVQRVTNLAPAANATDYSSYNVLVKEVIFHPCIVTHDKPLANGPHYELQSTIACNQVSIPGQSCQLTYSVPPSTYSLGFFIQPSAIGVDNSWSATKFNASGLEISMTRSPRLLYAGQQQPAVDRNMTVTAGSGVSLRGLQTMYYWYMSSLGFNENDANGIEAFYEWLNLGAIYRFRFDKSQTEAVTMALANLSFSYAPTSGVALAWMASQSDSMIKFEYSNGVVVNVQVQQV